AREARRNRHSRLPRGWGGGACPGPRHFQYHGTACTRWAESTKRRDHQNPSQQSSAVSRRQSRQGCSQSAEGCGSQEIDSVKEIGSAEVKRLRQSQPIKKAWKLKGTAGDPPLGPPVPNWLARQLPPLGGMNG